MEQTKKYDEDQKNRIYKYRETHKEEYREYQRNYFSKIRMADPVKKERVREVNRLAVKRYREKKLEEKKQNEISPLKIRC